MQNKPNSNQISENPKTNANVFITKVYENDTALRPKKTNPNKANFKRGRLLIAPMLPLYKLSNVQSYSRHNLKVKFPVERAWSGIKKIGLMKRLWHIGGWMSDLGKLRFMFGH